MNESSAPSIGVRRATQRDLDAVWPLVSEFASAQRPTKERFALTFASVVDDDRCLVSVAESSTGIQGYLFAIRLDTFFADRPVVWVQELMVAETMRRSGCGTALMSTAEAWARECNAAYVSLASRRAGEFYLAIGYDAAATFYKKRLD